MAKKKSAALPKIQLYPTERVLRRVEAYKDKLSLEMDRPLSISQVAAILIQERLAQLGFQDELPLTGPKK